MRFAETSLLLLVAGGVGCHAPEARAEPRADGVAVLELFTSEGCSSCPPADAVLADLARDPRVFALSYHVDYWDQLGWPDRFSSADNTERQSAYVAVFGTRSVYTPELVVGGRQGFVGSNRAKAEAAVAAALATPAVTKLSLKVRASDPDTLHIEYTASPAPPGSVIQVALVDREASTQVRAGENAGKLLRHVDVVRAFTASTLASAGTVDLRVPAGGSTEEEEVVAFVQRRGMGEILGAARAAAR
jgi:hypothetical protein